MKQWALVLGFGAVLHAVLFQWLGGLILAATGSVPPVLVLLVMWAAALFSAIKVAPMLEGTDEPPPSFIALLLVAAGATLLIRLLQSFGVTFGFGKMGLFIIQVAQWGLLLSAALVTRLFKPRVMLFIGLTAFALQLQAALILGALALRVPDWIELTITVAVALLIAHSFCSGEESPADRVTRPLALWWFAASGALVVLMGREDLWLRSWVQILLWLSFLVSFVVLVRSIEPDDPDHKPSALGAGYGALLAVFVALFVIVASVFNVSEMVSRRFAFTAGSGLRSWLPLLVSGTVAVLIMFFLQLGRRMRTTGPGRKALGWGLALYVIGVLAGGSVFGALSSDGKMIDFLIAFAWFSLLVVPVMVLAQMLLAVGLLRVVFTLDPPPRG